MRWYDQIANREREATVGVLSAGRLNVLYAALYGFVIFSRFLNSLATTSVLVDGSQLGDCIPCELMVLIFLTVTVVPSMARVLMLMNLSSFTRGYTNGCEWSIMSLFACSASLNHTPIPLCHT